MSDSFTRREAIGGAALGAGAATLGAMKAIAQTGPRKTFVLIHGAYHGGWCCLKVRDILEKQGHKVYAPSLTGLADRSHLLSMNLTLDTHITDIVNLFKWEDINNGCLAVHSGGGWPGSGGSMASSGRSGIVGGSPGSVIGGLGTGIWKYPAPATPAVVAMKTTSTPARAFANIAAPTRGGRS